MKAALLYKGRDLRIENADKPCPSDNEVLIRVKIAGLCGSDLHRYLGDRPVKNYPMILGHEFAGVVEKTGKDVQNIKSGDRVVANPFFTCDRCIFCISGHRNICQSRFCLGQHVPGVFAEYVKVPDYGVWAISNHVPDEEAVMVEPTAVVLRAIKKCGSLIGKKVVVLGAGTMGLLITQLAKSSGAEVIVSDVVDRKLDISKKMGADHIINAMHEDPVETVKKLTGGYGAQVVIETAGIPSTVEQAIEMVQPGGKVVLLGLSTKVAGIRPIDVAGKEINICGTVYYNEEFGEAVGLINSKKMDFTNIISHALPLEQCQAGFEMMAGGKEAVKVLLKID
jgi:2-desacetyl-2-hydroxyethyl bacteriochlorophyllide A dehydrogenase